MYAQSNKIAVDSNALSYLIEALGSFSGPPIGNAAAEKIALARCYLYRSEETLFCVTPTVEAEYSKISDHKRLIDHASRYFLHTQVLGNPPNKADIILRTHTLNAYHADVDDCRIVAECEALDVSVLLTSDRKLRNAMKKVDTQLSVLSGQQYWEKMGIAPGDAPTMALHPDDPLNHATWWQV